MHNELFRVTQLIDLNKYDVEEFYMFLYNNAFQYFEKKIIKLINNRYNSFLLMALTNNNNYYY